MSDGNDFVHDMKMKLVGMCEHHQIAHDVTVIEKCLRDFSTTLLHPCCYIQLRTAAKQADRRVLNWRFELRAEDARQSGDEALLSPWRCAERYPAARHLAALIGTLSGGGFHTHSIGADFDVRAGLVKLWHFGAVSLDQFVDVVTCLPGPLLGSLIEAQDALADWGYTAVYCAGVDLTALSVNLYFRYRSRVEPRTILDRLAIDASAVDPALLAFCGLAAAAVAFTFNWTSDSVERVCFYIPTTALLDGCPECPQLADYMRSYQLPESDVAPPVRHAGFIGCSFGNAGNYLKFEYDFKRNYYDFLSDTMLFLKQHGFDP